MSLIKNQPLEYDVIIIGAGIAGLVCANYLAKYKLKTLLVEKESNVGGYCTSFKRNGFFFDSCVHSFGSCRKNGIITSTLNALGIKNDNIFVKSDPTDLIIIGDAEYYIHRNIDKTTSDLQRRFSKEKHAIKTFFSLIKTTNTFALYSDISMYQTFDALLNKFFKDQQLKAIFKIFLGNIGLPSTRVSTLTALTLFREHIFDGGYYPKGGVQRFADILLANFIKNNGDVLLETKVENIIIKNFEARGIAFKNKSIRSKRIISACDMRQTFHRLLRNKRSKDEAMKIINKYKPSISGFNVYVGVDSKINSFFKQTTANIWYCKDYEVDDEYKKMIEGDFLTNGSFVFCSSPTLKDKTLNTKNKDSLELMILAPYISASYWEKNKDKIKLNVLRRASNVIPELEKKIEITDCATPVTLEKYTENYQGALYGWASTPSQVGINRISFEKMPIKNISFAGHWSGLPAGYGGIANVTYSGKIAAKSILKNRLRNSQ